MMEPRFNGVMNDVLLLVYRTDGINIIIDQLAVSGGNSKYARVYTVRKIETLAVCTPLLQDLTNLGYIAWRTVRSGCCWIHDASSVHGGAGTFFTRISVFHMVDPRFIHLVTFSFILFVPKFCPFLEYPHVDPSSQLTVPPYLLASINSPLCGIKYENNLKFITRSVAVFCYVVLFVARSPLHSQNSILYFWVQTGEEHTVSGPSCGKRKPETFQFACCY